MNNKLFILLSLVISSLYSCKETSNEVGLEQHIINLEADSTTVILKVKSHNYWLAGCRTIINNQIKTEIIPEINSKYINGKWFSFDGSKENQISLTIQPNDTTDRSVIFTLQYLDWHEELKVNQKSRNSSE